MKQIAVLMLCLALGCASPEFSGKNLVFEICPAVPEQTDGFREMTVYGTSDVIFCRDTVLLDNRALSSAITEEIDGRTAVRVFLTPEGRDRFAAVTEACTGSRLGMIVDGRLLSAPLVQRKISEGQLLIMGMLSTAEAKRIAEGITEKQ